MSVQTTVYGQRDAGRARTHTCTALGHAGITFEVVDVHDAGLVDELQGRDVRKLPLVTTSTGESWTGLRIDRVVELRRNTYKGLAV